MFVGINKKIITFIMLIVVGLSLFSFLNEESIKVIAFDVPQNNLTIVIDAGHGGKDWGAQGIDTGVRESDLNLEYSRTLEKYFKNIGFNVVQTRVNKDSLCAGERFIKLEDMGARKAVVKKVKPELFISMHMNSFPEMRSQYGAQLFYNTGNEKSKILSELAQNEFNKVQNKKRSVLSGDFYVLRELEIPSIIVECGFLSNAIEEQLLQTKEHREKLCGCILTSVMKYFTNNI